MHSSAREATDGLPADNDRKRDSHGYHHTRSSRCYPATAPVKRAVSNKGKAPISAAAAKAVTDATDAKRAATFVKAFKAAARSEVANTGRLADIQAAIAKNRVHMVRALVGMSTCHQFQKSGKLNLTAAAAELGMVRTSLANHRKAMDAFIAKGVQVASPTPEQWEIDAVNTAWAAAAKAVKASTIKAKSAPAGGTDTDDDTAGGAPAQSTAKPVNADSADVDLISHLAAAVKIMDHATLESTTLDTASDMLEAMISKLAELHAKLEA